MDLLSLSLNMSKFTAEIPQNRWFPDFEHRSAYPGPVQLDFFTAVPNGFAEDCSIVARQRVLSLKALPLGGCTKAQPGAVAQQLEITSG